MTGIPAWPNTSISNSLPIMGECHLWYSSWISILFSGLTKPTEKSRNKGRHLPIFGLMPIEMSSRISTESLSLRSAALGRSVQVDLYLPPVHLSDPPAVHLHTDAGSRDAPSRDGMSLLLINDGQDLGKLGLTAV